MGLCTLGCDVGMVWGDRKLLDALEEGVFPLLPRIQQRRVHVEPGVTYATGRSVFGHSSSSKVFQLLHHSISRKPTDTEGRLDEHQAHSSMSQNASTFAVLHTVTLSNVLTFDTRNAAHTIISVPIIAQRRKHCIVISPYDRLPNIGHLRS